MTRAGRRAIRSLAPAVAVIMVAGCAQPSPGRTANPSPTGVRPTTTIPPTRLPDPGDASTLLGRSRIAPRPSGPNSYLRSAFGTSWSDTDGNGCNQRDDVLLRDSLPGTVQVRRQGRCDHDVIAGSWVDPYTGRRLRFDHLKKPAEAEAIQIDHVVPLAEAWVSGASTWSADRRHRFANDLTELLAVDGPTNAGKGADDPAAWRPRKAYQCAYAIRWIVVKSRWDLAVDPSERTALRQMLGRCSR